MPVPIYNAAQGLTEKPPKLIEFARELKKSTLEVLDAAKKTCRRGSNQKTRTRT